MSHLHNNDTSKSNGKSITTNSTPQLQSLKSRLPPAITKLSKSIIATPQARPISITTISQPIEEDFFSFRPDNNTPASKYSKKELPLYNITCHTDVNPSSYLQSPSEDTIFYHDTIQVKTIKQEDQLANSSLSISDIDFSTTDSSTPRVTMPKPTSRARSKNNIAFLAYDSAAKEAELNAFHAQCHSTQKETRNKYGF